VDVFNNAGTYSKGGAGTNRITAIFNNNGTLNLTAGRLDLSGGGTHTGTISGAGTLEFGAGNSRLLGSASVIVSNLVVSGGTMTNLGSFLVSAARSLLPAARSSRRPAYSMDWAAPSRSMPERSI
jgi:hypothetical protein